MLDLLVTVKSMGEAGDNREVFSICIRVVAFWNYWIITQCVFIVILD